MKRNTLWWTTGFLVVVAVLAALSYVTYRVHGLLKAQERALLQSRTDELARSALWRMDTDLMGRLSDLNASAPSATTSGRFAATGIWGGGQVSEGFPILYAFIRDQRGTITGDGSEAAKALRSRIERETELISAAPGIPMATGITQSALQGDFIQRNSNVANRVFSNQSPSPGEGMHAVFQPRLIDEQHVALIRDLDIQSGSTRQILVLDWPLIRKRLCDGIRDLLPHASLLLTARASTAAYPLAAFPIALVPGPLDEPLSSTAPVIISLFSAWLAVIVAVIAVVITVLALIAAAERKSAFANAVTHELRTPITSLRLYADMLAEGMITDPVKRLEYLQTIRAESERLGTLIENVLAFARLERVRDRPAMRIHSARELIHRCQDRLQRRAIEAGMTLSIHLPPVEDAPDGICADPEMVEQILMNLVDNCCKYGRTDSDEKIEISLEAKAHHPISITVRDYGPGVAQDVLPKLFVEFSRSANSTKVGIGLGLALSRRLARHMHVRLEHQAQRHGASFILTWDKIQGGA